MRGSAWKGAVATLKTLAWSGPVIICIDDLLVGPARVKGRSMNPTLNPSDTPSDDVVLVQKWGTRLYTYVRGSVVTLRSPSEPHTLLVKRLIAVEGDWVAIPGRLEVQKIPKGHCWVEGDCPSMSYDSRNKFGAVPAALIEGRVSHILWPLSRIGHVPNHMPPGRLLARNDSAFSKDDSM